MQQKNNRFGDSNSNINGRASGAPKGNAAGNKRQSNPQIQPRRTVNPSVRGQSITHTSAHVNTARQVPNGRQAQSSYNVRQTTRTGTGAQQASLNVHNSQSTTREPGKLEKLHRWLKKTYTVDKKAIAQRELVRHDLVRERGSIDYIFFILVLIMLAFGTVMVYSASYAYSKSTYGDSYYIIFRQVMFVAAGLAVMFIASKLPPEFFRRMTVPIFIACVVMLCIVPIPIPGITVEHGGARRWLNLGFTEIQPSEFMKLGLAMMLAWYFDRFYERVIPPTRKWERYKYGVITPGVITGFVCGLIIIEKHLSGTIIMCLIGVLLIYVSGAPKFWMVPGVVGGMTLFGIALAIFPHAMRRITIWLDPASDPQGGGYQTLQGLYAIGSGGFFGTGLGNGYQKHMFVSQPQNDFIFTIVCEELGFIGAVAVILLFVLLIWRGFVIAMNAPDIYSQLLVMGIVGKIAIQAVLNIAVVTNSIPNTGISLPFFSYGGSSLFVLLGEMGIVLSISRFSRQRK